MALRSSAAADAELVAAPPTHAAVPIRLTNVRRDGILFVLLRDKDQYRQDCQIKAKGRLLTVPLRRLPHLEPLAADHHEAKEPDEKAETGGHDRQSLGAVEACCRRTQVAQQQNRCAGKAKCRCARAGYDQGISRLP